MKVDDQLGDTLAGELLHGGFDIALEPIEVVGAEGAHIHLELDQQGKKVLASMLLTAPVLPSGRMYDLMAPALPATGGIVGTYC